jgi:DinB family protein
MDPRYPVGKLQIPASITPDARKQMMDEIAAAPAKFRAAFQGLNEAQLGTPYREGGWTLRQVAHHVPDSHLNAYCRLKFALTEDKPTIKPYDESLWANLADTRDTPIETSLALLENLHSRWDRLWRSLKTDDFARRLIHPDYPDPKNIDWLLCVYSWHGRHHTAHVTTLRQQKGW